MKASRQILRLFERFSRQMAPDSEASSDYYKNLLLRLHVSVEYPLIFLFHPAIEASSKESLKSPQSLWRLLFQAASMIVVDWSCESFLPHFPAPSPSKNQNRDNQESECSSAAVDLANEFAIPRATMLLAPIFLEKMPYLRNLTCGLHFGAVLIWLSVRQLYVGMSIRAFATSIAMSWAKSKTPEDGATVHKEAISEHEVILPSWREVCRFIMGKAK